MKTFRRRRNVLVPAILALAFLGFIVTPYPVGAQSSSPKPIITWRAFTYAPPYFSGKLLPTGNSFVRVSVELIDRGRFVSLSGQRIYWYINDEFLDSGSGKQTVFFRTPSRPGSTVGVRVSLPDYAGGVLHAIEIPSVQPEAVIDAPAPLGRVADQSLRVFARPFFFNVGGFNALSVSWTAGGVAPEEATNPETLDVDLKNFTRSAPLSLELTVRNPGKLFEAARKELSLIIER